MSVFVVIYHGHDEGEFEVEGVFTERLLADAFVAAKSAGFISPAHYSSQHYEVVETPLDAIPP